jgi:hypothetical protein
VLEAVENMLCVKVLEVMRCVLLSTLEAVEGVRYVLELLEIISCVVEVMEGMRHDLVVVDGMLYVL